jgi:hypothetical protein
MYLWTFGDDSFSVASHATHVYSHNGTYHVCLYVVNANDTSCRSGHCENIIVHYNDTMIPQSAARASFDYETTDPSVNSITFTSTSTGSGLTYLWDFGDGEYSTDMNPLHSFANKDWYLVCLKVTGNGSDSYCQNVYPDKVTSAVKTIISNTHQGLSVYPNPAGASVTVKFNAPEEGSVTLTIRDLSGKLIRSTSLDSRLGANEITIETESLETGFYLVGIFGRSIDAQVKLIK